MLRHLALPVKCLRTAATLSAAVAIAAFPPAVRAQRSDPQLVRDLLAIETEIARANRECDYRYFERVEATEFIFTDARGNVTTREQDLAGEKDCRRSTSTTVLTEPRAFRIGDTAVWSSLSTVSGVNREGVAFTRVSRFTDVFVWRDARWQLIAGHESRVPSP